MAAEQRAQALRRARALRQVRVERGSAPQEAARAQALLAELRARYWFTDQELDAQQSSAEKPEAPAATTPGVTSGQNVDGLRVGSVRRWDPAAGRYAPAASGW